MKRMIYLILWALIIVSLVHSIPKRQLGDINGDGKATTTDLVMLSRYLAELIELDEFQLKYADMNSDGIIDVLDLALLRRKLAGNEKAEIME